MRIVVGLSGGVDSSVAALKLVEQGHEVIGLFMRNWNDTSVTISDECLWIDDSNDAMLVAEHLGIPFQVIDLSNEYRERTLITCSVNTKLEERPTLMCCAIEKSSFYFLNLL